MQIGQPRRARDDHAIDDARELDGYVGRDLAQRRQVRGQDDLEHLPRVLAARRQNPRQAPVDHEPERPHVGAVIHVALAEELLGRHVVRRAEHDAAGRERRRRTIFVLDGELGDAEVEHLHDGLIVTLAAREEDVLGLEVAVNDSERVCGADRRDHGQQQPRRLGDREAAVPLELRRKGLALEALHDDGRGAVVEVEHFAHRDDVRVLHGGGGARLAEEAAARVGLARLHELHGDALVGRELGRLPHDAHAALAEQRLEPKPPREDVTALEEFTRHAATLSANAA